jgi:hypothetical protein
MLRDAFSQCELSRERQIAVVFIPSNCCLGGGDGSSRRSEVGIEILQPQDLRIVAGLSSNAID